MNARTLKAAAAPEFDAAALAQLESMGFPAIRCQKALLATGNSDPEAAMNWLFEHMEAPGLDEPIPAKSGGGGSSSAAVDPETISMLQDMGFTEAQARKALRETVRQTSGPCPSMRADCQGHRTSTWNAL